MEPKLKAVILIISDVASKDPTSNRISGALVPILAREGKWEPPTIRIIPDNVFQIQQAICDCTDGPNWYNLILLSRGTGFPVKDITAETVTSVLHRHAQGLVLSGHDMIAESLKLPPFASVREKSLIITLPGSPKGAVEDLEAVVKVLPHACAQRASANPRSLNAGGTKNMENEAGVTVDQPIPQLQPQPPLHLHHHHHHCHTCGHAIPKAYTSALDRSQSKKRAVGPNQRYHVSPDPMLSVEEALRIIDEQTPTPIVVNTPVTTSITGSVIAEDVYAVKMVPAYRTSAIDGYAIIAEEGKSTNGVFPVASIAHTNVNGALEPLKLGTIARISADAPLPPNANAVVLVEDTVPASLALNDQEEATVQILLDDVAPGENVREPGSDVALNSKIFARGDLISPAGGEIGLFAAAGTRSIKVFKKPRVGILSIGDELVEHPDPYILIGDKSHDSNRLSVISCLTSWGFEAMDLGIAGGTQIGELKHALRESSSAEVIVITGSVSMGQPDLLKHTIEHSLGGTIHFSQVSMKPGKHITFATISSKTASANVTAKHPQQEERTSRLIFSLPRDPASALVTLNLFVLPSLHKLAGLGEGSQAIGTKPWMAPQLGLPRVAVVLTHHFPLDPTHTEYHRAIVTGSRSDGRLYATSIGAEGVGQRSLHIESIAKVNALVVLRPGRGVGIKGEIVEALMMGPIYGSDTRIIC